MRRILALLLALISGPALAETLAQIPPKFPIPWGNSAGASYLRPIPQGSQIGIQNCAASLTDGFPPLTFVSQAAGGCPPFGQDMNGILKQITQWNGWQAAGGAVQFDSAFAASIGGYPKGSLLSSSAIGFWWVSTIDNNSNNPDTGGAGWVIAPLCGVTTTQSRSANSGIYAACFGVLANGSTDDTAAWNAAISYANANPGTRLIAPTGNSVISALNAFTANDSYIVCATGVGACTLSHSATNALTWNSGAAGGGLIDMGLNNTGSACNNTVLVAGASSQLQFKRLILGTGIGTLATFGTGPGANSAGTTSWQSLYSPHGVANAACPLFKFVDGFGFQLQDSTIFIQSAGVVGRYFMAADISAGNTWDAFLVENNLVQFFQSILEASPTGGGLLLDGKFVGNFIDNCIGSCFGMSVGAGSSMSGFSIQDNWMDNDTGHTDCINIASTGGTLAGFQLLNNRISSCGGSGVLFGSFSGTGPVYGTQIQNNLFYTLNVLSTGSASCIRVSGDGVDGVFKDTQVTGNRCLQTSFFGGNLPTFGIYVDVIATGGPGADGVIIQGNRAFGTTANYVLPRQATNSNVSNNVGLASTSANISVGASPFTYIASMQPESVYIFGGTVSSVTTGTGTQLCAASPCAVALAPFEQIAVTYSVIPFMNKVLH